MPDSGEKELYLTFDDGPVSGPTEFVLETLKRSDAKATFFCIGDNIRKHSAVFRQVVAEGHAVGNHTFNHLNGWKTDTSHYIENTIQCDREIKSNLQALKHPEVSLFRPPYGRITRDQISALKDLKIIMWDVLSIDYNTGLSGEKCLTNTIRATRPGSIIVFHDSYKAEKNLTAVLPRFIDHFTALGFSFKAITA